MSLIEKTNKDFIQLLSSKEAVPGGGGASAMVGAIGIALGNMVANLTKGKKKYANVEEDIISLSNRASQLQKRLLELIDEDAEGFLPLSKAYSLPSETEEEKVKKNKIMEECLLMASKVPLEIMESCAKAIEIQKEFAKKGSKLAISDAGVGVCFCKAAMEGASLNVFINTSYMKNKEKAKEIDKKANDILNKYIPIADEIFYYVKERL